MAGKASISQLSWPFQLRRTRALSLVLSLLCFYKPLCVISPRALLLALATGWENVLAVESSAATCRHSTHAWLKPSLSPPNWLAWLLPLCPWWWVGQGLWGQQAKASLRFAHQTMGLHEALRLWCEGSNSTWHIVVASCSRIFISRKEHLGDFSRRICLNRQYPPYIGFHQDCSRLHIYIRKQNNSYLGAISNSSMKKHHVTKQFTIQKSSKSNI